MNMVKNMELVHLDGQITHNISASSITTTYKERESILGVMEENMKGSGRITKCMEKEPSLGLMEGSMLVNMLKTKNKDMENLFGLMEGPTREIGSMGNSMGKEFMLPLKGLKSMVNGKMEKGLDGLEEGMEKT